MKRKIIKIDEELCNGCGECVPQCAEGSLRIVNGKAKLVADKLCDGLGACLGACPRGALVIEEREAEEFDETAVTAFLAAEKNQQNCPSVQLHSFQAKARQQATLPAFSKIGKKRNTGEVSLLTHWPVQIRLIPANAPFLKESELLVAADCTAISVPNFQEKYVAGRVVAMGCPKFDDRESYIDKFTQIFSIGQVKNITILIMEVPCCSAMLSIIKIALQNANIQISVTQITLSLQGEEIARTEW